MKLGSNRRKSLGVIAMVVPTSVASIAFMSAPAFADQTITPPGPITRLLITSDLNCGVSYQGDSSPEFFDDTACGTFLALGQDVFGPSNVPAGNSYDPYTPVSQDQSGSGTQSDPYVINTAVQAGPSVTLTQADSYITGQNAYRTDTTITNHGSSAANVVLYHAADCYLQDSDAGYGDYDPVTGTVTCRGVDANGNPGDRVEQFIPLSSSSNYLEDYYSSVWNAVSTGNPLPNQCAQCDNLVDNGMGLSWSLSIPAGASMTRSLLTNFSPQGLVPLVSSTDAQPSSVSPGDDVDITATVANPNSSTVDLSSVTVVIPPGASYVPGSTSGAPEPTVNGQTLTFAGPLPVAAGGSIAITFTITAPTASGAAEVDTSADAGAVPVLPSSDTFTVEGGGGGNNPPVAQDDAYTTTTGATLTVGPPGVLANDSDPDNDALTAQLVAPTSNGTLNLNADGSFTYTPNAGFMGTDVFSYTASDGSLQSEPAMVSIDVAPAATTLRCTIVGSPGDDVLVGGPGNDIICGADGNDRLIGNGGNDVLIGGPGDDRLFGTVGNDVLIGGFGNDQLFGSYGDDVLIGGMGQDYLTGGPGHDRLLEGPIGGVCKVTPQC